MKMKLSLLHFALLAFIPASVEASQVPKPPFTVRCVDDFSGAIFRLTIQSTGFAYNIDGGNEFTASRAWWNWSQNIASQVGEPKSFSMRLPILGATFVLNYGHNSLDFDMSRLDAKKLNFLDTFAEGECIFIPVIPIPRNIDEGSKFKGPSDEKSPSLNSLVDFRSELSRVFHREVSHF
ncbi:MAG: hypothetical protein KKG78_17865 [Alphaproteobacteria bacterium]|nr:hypothetical protein [Alphaproteobacteria bacterium]